MIATLLLQRPPCPPFCPPPDGVSDATAWILLASLLAIWAVVKLYVILREG